ncbi:MAG: hypothetical protein H2172_02315 [Opitutus sp.]|nr:hypothetical protein [Opitutus sp.]MCS6247270.1 hypothetical protein [Opitutus sp.]MCS6273327.1 hypothetical protein [Opitutus sp.]MCS6278126.1 hypothetical protein [Opitutus sp.]MCS6299236.1 hypothetical protein [Opitutus sp.]
MSPIWQAIEIVGAGARGIARWQKGLAPADLALLRPYLTPSAERATTHRCERTDRGAGCRYRIVEHDDDTLVGVCDEGRCEKRVFTADELVLYGLNDRKLATDIARALAVSPVAEPLHGTPAVLHIATLLGSAGLAVPVILIRASCPVQLLQYLQKLSYDRREGGLILLLPTDSSLGQVPCDFAEKRRWPFFILDEHLFFRPQGIQVTSSARDELDALAEGLLGQAPRSRFPTPTGARWTDVQITFFTTDTYQAKVSVRGSPVRTLTAADFGMEDKRTKKPNDQWTLLLGLAGGKGRFDRQLAARMKFTAGKHHKLRLNEALRATFGIPGDPVDWTEAENCWASNFAISLQ